MVKYYGAKRGSLSGRGCLAYMISPKRAETMDEKHPATPELHQPYRFRECFDSYNVSPIVCRGVCTPSQENPPQPSEIITPEVATRNPHLPNTPHRIVKTSPNGRGVHTISPPAPSNTHHKIPKVLVNHLSDMGETFSE